MNKLCCGSVERPRLKVFQPFYRCCCLCSATNKIVDHTAPTLKLEKAEIIVDQTTAIILESLSVLALFLTLCRDLFVKSFILSICYQAVW